ncbi:MAG: MaoC family dehydratase [Actinomycetes bacterium]
MASLSFADVAVGMELPALEIPITPTLIVAGALASRDYQDVHHDPALSKERGSPDIFMNILTTNGIVGRYVTDWTGPAGMLHEVKIRLGAPNYPGDLMTLTGAVTAIEDQGERGSLTVSLKGSNASGDHVVGTVLVSLPKEAK